MRTGDRRRAARVQAAVALATAAAATGACAVAWPACGKDDLPEGEITGEVATMLEHLPGDAWAVIGIRAARARAVPALARLLEWMPAPPVDRAIAENCGLDPRRGADLAVATLGGGPGAERVFVAIRGSFTRDSVATCVNELSDRTGEAIPITQEGSLTVYGARHKRSHIYWPTREVAIAAPLADDAPAALAALVEQAGVRTDARLMSYVGRVRTGAAFWMAGPLPAAVQKQLARLPGAPALQGFFASADGEGSGVRVILGLRLAGAKQAEAAAVTFRDERAELAASAADPRAAAIVEKVEVTQGGSDIALTASLTPEEAALLIDRLAGMTGLPAPGARPGGAGAAGAGAAPGPAAGSSDAGAKRQP
ncbi:MAG TPA: hypothetical protein VKB80_34485 [Kofleriaceae bacterium]|nr:hypothetical protein [Kofleriaceae bacterium]